MLTINRRLPNPNRWWFTAVGAILAAILVVALRPWDLVSGFLIGAPFGRDFVNFWLGGKLGLDGNLDLLIDLQAYNALLLNIFQHNPLPSFVYSYPPHSLLLLTPFGALPYVPAAILWTALNIGCIAAATRLLTNDWTWAIIACLSPAVLIMVLYGHFGGVLGLLAIYSLLRAEQSPLAVGVCIALTTVKPQFALTLGLFLLATGYWRAVMWSVPATLLLVAASVAAFGVQSWVNYIAWTLPFHAELLSNFDIELLRTAISVYAGARMAGLANWAAYAAQYTFSIAVFWQAVVRFRRDGANAHTIALALFAVLASLPYYNGYDLAIVAPALTLALFDQRVDAPLLSYIPAAVLWLAPIFALPFGLMELPVVPLIVAATLLLALFARSRTSHEFAATPA